MTFGKWPPMDSNGVGDKKKNKGVESIQKNSFENQEKDFEKIKEEFSEWVDKHLDSLTEKEQVLKSETWMGLAFDKMEELLSRSQDYENNNSSKYSELAKIFLEKILDISKEFDDGEANDREKNFFNNLRRNYFFSSETIDNLLEIDNLIELLSKGVESEKFRNNIISYINFSLEYRLNWSDNEVVDKIVEKVDSAPLATKLKILKTLSWIGRTVGFGADKKDENIREVFDKIISDTDIYLVKYFAELMQSSSEYDDYEYKAEVKELIFKENIYLRNEFGFKLYENNFLSNTSSDFISVLDSAAYPKKLVDKENQELADEYPEILKIFHNPEIRLFVEKDLSLNFSVISLKDQIHFMNFLAGESQETFDRLKGLFEKNKIQNEKLLKSFLATSGDLDFGENILKIGETYSPEITNLIFEKYAEFAEITDSIEETLKNEFGVEGDNQEMISEIRDNILKTAKDLLKKYSQENIENLDLEEVKKELAETKAELSLFVSAFKSLKECGEACSLENIKSIVLEKKKGLDLLEDKELLDEMEKIYQENYPDELGFSDEFRKKLIKGLEEKIKKDKVEFFVIKFKDELIGFNSFEFKSDDEIEFANFNMKNGAKGGKIGESLLEESLYKYAEKYKIKAVTLTDSKVFDYYTKKLGFKVLENTKSELLGREIVEIELDRRRED